MYTSMSHIMSINTINNNKINKKIEQKCSKFLFHVISLKTNIENN